MSLFWDLESNGIKVEEPTPVENFLRNIKMNENINSNETSLPFKDDFVLVPDKYELCRKRLMSLYKILKNDVEHFKMELLNTLIPQTRNQVKYTIFHITQLFVFTKNYEGSCSI